MQFPRGKNVLRKGFVIKTISSVDLANALLSERNADLKDQLVFVDEYGNSSTHNLVEAWYWVRISTPSGVDWYNAADSDEGLTRVYNLVKMAEHTEDATVSVYRIEREGFETLDSPD
jgi:hypothetical protein